MAENLVFQLEIVDPEGNRRQISLGTETTIGRQVGNDVVIDDQRVSRQHAVIECHDDACVLTDLESSNGTYIEDERLTPNVPTPLPSGAEIRMGSSILRLTAEPIARPEGMGGEASAAIETPPEAGPPAMPSVDEQGSTEQGEEPQEAARPIPGEAGTSGPSAAESEPPEERAAPPPPPPERGSARAQPPEGGSGSDGRLPPGQDIYSSRLLGYLPGIYHTEFMSRFLGIFEAILTPIEWNIDNFDLFLDPGTAPAAFLSWLAEWFDITYDPSWTEAQRRQLLREAHRIYARRGTRWALSRVLEIYTGSSPEIVDSDDALEPFTFSVILPVQAAEMCRDLIERLIDAHKPTHTMYTLEFKP